MINQDAPRVLPSTFLLPALAVVAATFAMSLWVASKEWFYGDDFIFLRLAQLPGSWWDVFVPIKPRLWWSYRPLTIDAFFALGFSLVGMQAFPFLYVVLLVHFLSGLVVFRIALLFGLERRVSCFVGCLFVLMYPSLHEIFWASAFQPVAAIFCYLVSVALFLQYLEGGRRGWLFASVGAQFVGHLCNELAVTLPGVLAVLALAHGSGAARVRVANAIRRTWPFALVLAAYLLFRFIVLAPPKMKPPAFYYEPRFGLHMLRNIGRYVVMLVHEHWLHGAGLAVLLGIGWTAVLGSSDSSEARRLFRRSASLLTWMLLAMIPFVGIWFAQHRMVMVIEAPFCLLIGAHLDAMWSRWSRSRPQLLEWSMIALLVAAVPYQTLLERGRKPLGDLNRQIVRLMRTHYPNPEEGTCVALQTRPGDEWRPGDLFAVWFVTSGVLSAVYPGQGIELRVPDHKSLRQDPAPECVVLEVLSRNEVVFGRDPTNRPRHPPKR